MVKPSIITWLINKLMKNVNVHLLVYSVPTVRETVIHTYQQLIIIIEIH